MKAPLSWLRDYVEIDLSPEELASRLALTGTEVERVDRVGAPVDPSVQERFVVGRVVSREKHPDADKLSVCTVDVGEEEPRTIVCGAANIDSGQTVAVVLPGGVLANGMEIGEAKLRGVRSSGMILSAAELGFEAKSPGTMVLPQAWPVGARLGDYLPVSDAVLEIEVTPNRPDCLSIKGLAREVAAVTEKPFSETQEYPYEVAERTAEEDISVEVWDPDLCPRYAGRVIRGVSVAESPDWLKARVTEAGMRPVNNVVDVTNYVMWALGQPLHAFDLHTIAERRIIVRRARDGEKITTLDDTERTLTSDMLVIADAEKPSVIAGIMGSLDSEVTDQTTDVFLEAANFNRASILKTESALGLRSESSTRFEKGLDPNMIPKALDMACMLLSRVCGGTVSRGTLDVAAGEVEPWELVLRASRVEQVLGMDVPLEAMAEILERLGCGVESGVGGLRVNVPTFRQDLEREIDLVEEVVRVYGLDRLPATQPARPAGGGGLTVEQRRVRGVQDLLVGAGLNQAINYAFIDPAWLELLRLEEDDPRRKPVVIDNPLSREQSVMRTMLLPGLLATAARNRSVREERAHLFETGVTFHPREKPERLAGDVRDAGLPDEVNRVALVLAGPLRPESWTGGGEETDFFTVKGLVERLVEGLGVSAVYRPAQEPFLHPGKSAELVVGGEPAGWLGEIHPLVARAFDLAEGVLAAEVALPGLIGASLEVPLFEDLITFPAVEQDLALVVSQDVSAARVLEEIRRSGGELLRSARIFDVYEGPQVGEGRRSLALRLSFRSSERTLSEEEVHGVRERLLESLRDSLGVELRG